jgi:hypothetical protein
VQVKDAGGPEQSLAILRDEGFDVRTDEMRDALVDRFGDSLSTEQLDSLAGGRDGIEIATIVVVHDRCGRGHGCGRRGSRLNQRLSAMGACRIPCATGLVGGARAVTQTDSTAAP